MSRPALDQANQIRGQLQGLGRLLKERLPANFAFVLLVASIGKAGTTLYVANCQRADALQLMREFIAVNMEERNWQREMPQLEIEAEFDAYWESQKKRALSQDERQNARDAYMAGRMSA